MFESVKHAAAYLENREGGGGKGQEGATSPKDCALRSSLEGLFGEIFRRWRAPSGRKSPWRDFSEGFFVVGGSGCLKAPSNYIFPVKHSRLEGAEQSQRALSAPGGGGVAQCHPAYVPALTINC